MEISTVIKALRNGGSARRKAWFGNIYIKLVNDIIMVYDPSGPFSDMAFKYGPLQEDLMADDWEYPEAIKES